MRVGLVIAFVLAWLSVPSSAFAYVLEGDPWPDREIRYAVLTPRYAEAVHAAARVWNRSGAGVRFVRGDEYDADVIVDYGGPACSGSAPVGFRWGRVTRVELGRGCNLRLVRLVAVHEFGHVLGLGHEEDRCSRMNPTYDDSGTPDGCRLRTLRSWLARPLLGDDLRGARALYGR